MKTPLTICLVFFFFIVSGLSAFGQTNEQIEKELIAGLKEIQKYSIYGGIYDEGALTIAQRSFEEKLSKSTEVASTLDYAFSELGGLMQIATSDDGTFRIYSWDMEDGGTMHRFARIYQFRDLKGNVYSMSERAQTEGMGPGFVTDIFSLSSNKGTLYIVCSTFIGSTKNYSQSASLYRIDGAKLNDEVKLIKTISGLTNALRFEYDNFSFIDQADRPTKLISFDNETRTLRIPIVIKDKEYPDGRVTNRWISYRFDGRYFVKVS